MGLLILAASRATIWKASCVSHLDASNNCESKVNMVRFVPRTDVVVQVIMIWVPYTTTNGQWIASKLLQGFFGAPVESLCEISVTDIYFTHETGTYIAIYGFFLVGSNFLAPVFAGFINEGQGWKWVLVRKL